MLGIMPRRNFLAFFSYDGTDFAGWQRLPEGERSVQAVIEAALGPIVGEAADQAFPGAPGLEIVGASRTDRGVHAEGQAASFHARTALSPEEIVSALNGALPPDLRCRSCREVDPRFHARYRAKGKLYRYRLHLGAPDPAARRFSLQVDEWLDLGAMGAAARLFVGEHDFGAFTNSHGPSEPARRIDEARVEKNGDFVELFFSGPGFLYNQVRIMSSALLEVGRGRLAPGAIARALETGDRSSIPGALGPYGLSLVEVRF
jgi:tRNA pseudouridine38-40 synthase